MSRQKRRFTFGEAESVVPTGAQKEVNDNLKLSRSEICVANYN